MSQKLHAAAGYDFMHSNTARAVFWSAMNAVELGVTLEQAFTCPVCGSFGTAPCLLADGTSLGFPERLRPPPERVPPPPMARPPRRGSKQKDRLVIESVDLRNLLLRWSGILSCSVGVDTNISRSLAGFLVLGHARFV